MRYRDRATIKQVTTHQNRAEYKEPAAITDRERRRIRQRWLTNVRLIMPDPIWWDSLTDDEKTEVAHEYRYKSQYQDKDNFQELKQKFPGSLEYIRNTKLEKLLR